MSTDDEIDPKLVRRAVNTSIKAEQAFAQQPELAQHAAANATLAEGNIRASEMIGFAAAEYAEQGQLGAATLARELVSQYALIASKHMALARLLDPSKATLVNATGQPVN